MQKLKIKVINLINLFRNFFENIFSSRKKTMQFIAYFVFTVLFLIQIAIILINNSFYSNFSDDILQYYTIMEDFITSLKNGSFSMFNLNNYFGASFFSDIYYIPLDIFTFITFLLSYIMPVELAYSSTELFKIFIGVMTLAYYFHLKGLQNRTIFWLSIFYLVSGGMVSYMAFPAFLSMTFYLPLALIVIHFYIKKKLWIVPVFALILIFYNFYLAYTVLVFTAFAYLLEYFKAGKTRFLKFIKDGVVFFLLLLLGVLMGAIILLPSINFILEEAYRSTGAFDAWIINIGSYELQLFQPNIYIRYLAKIFTEQRGIGFYGFEGQYWLEHVSLYITIIGFAYMSQIFFMKDRISRIYKVTFIIILIFMIFPLFSYVFSGTLDQPYTRWINFIPLIQILALSHVFEKIGFEKVNMKTMTITISFLLALVGFLIYYYIKQLGTDENFAAKDVLKVDTVLMGVSALYLIVVLVFGWLKKFTIIKWFVWIEVTVAFVYIYTGPFAISNKIDTFNSMHEINDFLEDNLVKDEFYRVYVDIDNFNAERTNFNRMTSFPTNTRIFHSWTDAETNGISKMIFNSNEYQTKNKMNYFGYYINHFLGYRYILVSGDHDYALNDNHFTLVNQNEKYRLYELNYSTSFKVYDTYFNSSDQDSEYGNSLSELSKALIRQQAFVLAAIIDESKEYDMSQYDLKYLSGLDNSQVESLNPYRVVSYTKEEEHLSFNQEELKNYYVYDNENLDIRFEVGAVYIKFTNTFIDLDEFGEIFMEFEDGSTRACTLYETSEDDNLSLLPYHLKCEFWQTPERIYIEKNDALNVPPVFKMRSEQALNQAAYLEYDLSKIDLPEEEGIILFDMNLDFNKLFVTDEFGNELYLVDGYYYYENKPSRLYIFKTGDMYDYNDLFNLKLYYLIEGSENISESLVNSDIANSSLKIENSKINLEYDYLNVPDTDQIVMIPVAYSDDWQFTSEQVYDTISVSGGFIGLIIPEGTESVDIELRFVPNYLNLGLYISLGSAALYLSIFAIPLIIKRKKRG